MTTTTTRTTRETATRDALHEVSLREALAYAEGDLPPARQAAVGAHVAGCAYCRDRLAEVPEFDRMLAAEVETDGAPPPPGQLRLIAEVYRRARRQVRADWLWVLGVAAPLKLALLRTAFRSRETPGRRLTAGASALALTGAVLGYAFRRW